MIRKLLLIALTANIAVVGQADRNLQREKLTVGSSVKRLALVIGNGKYQKASPLDNPVNDANDMAVTLQSLGFEVVKGTDTNLVQMRRLIREFGEKLEVQKGVGLFYYAGHGVEVRGKNFLVPVDADIAREVETEDYAIDLNSIMRQMDNANNGFNIVILDACRNNPFSRGWNRSGDTGGLANVNAPTGTYIAFAAAPGSTASDGKGGRNGIFTGSLVKQLRRPGLKLEEVFKATREEVMSVTANKQVPWDSSSVKGDFYFKKLSLPPNSGTAVLGISKTETSQDREAWSFVAESKDPADLRDYLHEFPGGFHVETAKKKLDELLWAAARSSGDPAKVNEYLEEFPDGGNSGAARILARQLKSKSPSGGASSQNSGQGYTPVGDPRSAAEFYERGFASFRDKKYDAAIADSSKAIELDPSLARGYEVRCMAYFLRNEFEKARNDCTKAISIDPDVEDAYLYRASLTYKSTGSAEAAKPDFNRGHANMIANANRKLSQNPNDADALMKRAQAYLGSQNHASAISDYTAAIQQRPASAEAYRGRGGAYAGMQNWSAAEQDYLRSIELDPKDELSYLMADSAHSVQIKEYTSASNRRRGDYAIQIYTKGIERVPNSLLLYSSRGLNYRAYLQDYPRAASDYTKAIDLFLIDKKPEYESSFLLAISGLSETYREMKDMPQAAATLTRGIEVLPNSPMAYYYRGQFYRIWQKDNAKALADFVAGSQVGSERMWQKLNIDAVAEIDKGKAEELRRAAAEKQPKLP